MRHTESVPDSRAVPKQKRSRETFDRILDSADELFGQHGFHETAMSELIAHSGVRSGSLYRFFPDKISIAEALIERHRQRLGPIDKLLPTVSTPGELLTLADAVVAFIADHQRSNPGFRAVADIYTASEPGSAIYEIRQSQINAVLNATAFLDDQIDEIERRRMIMYVAEIINALLRNPPVDEDPGRQLAEIQRVVRGYIRQVLAG